MRLGLGQGLGAGQSSGGLTIVRDGLVMQHKYNTSAVQPLSDGAVYFASGDTIVCSDSNDFTFTAGNAFSVGCWFNSPSIGTDHLIGKTNNTSASHANNEWYFHLASGGKLCLQCFDASESAIIGRKYNTALSSGTWYHGFATYDGGTSDSSVKIYLDGRRVDDSNQNAGSGFASMDNTATDLTFGRTANGSVNYAGYMCNAGIWSRELTEAEIKSIMWKQYADLSTTEKTNLVSWWNLDTLTNNTTSNYNTSSGIDEKSLVLDEHNTYGDNLITQPSASSGWSFTYGTPNPAEAPATQSYSPSDSIGWIIDDDSDGDDGVFSPAFTSVAGAVYEVKFWAYTSETGASKLRAKLLQGDGSGLVVDGDDGGSVYDMNFSPTEANTWAQYIAYIKNDTANAGSNAKLIVTSGASSTDGAIYYIDDVSVREVKNAGVLK